MTHQTEQPEAAETDTRERILALLTHLGATRGSTPETSAAEASG